MRDATERMPEKNEIYDDDNASHHLMTLYELSKKHNDVFRHHVVAKLDSNAAKCFSLCAKWTREDVLQTKLVISRDFKVTDQDSLKLAVKLGMPLTVKMFNKAIEQGDRNDGVVEMLLRECKCQVDSTSASQAARFGRITVLELLMEENEKLFTHNAMTRAGKYILILF